MCEFNEIKNFGTGSFSFSPYETAWVASIPMPTDPTQPAFPKSLQWLKQNQLSDGSWGTNYPNSGYNKVLSTASAIVCLKKWERYSDPNLIESGIKAFKQNISNLDDPTVMPIGFELILPAVVDRALELGIDLNNEVVNRIRKERQIKLLQFANLKSLYNTESLTKSAWLSILEGLGPIFDILEIRELIAPNGMVGHSYSATAFAVINDPSLKKCFDAIKKAVDMNVGAIPAYQPLEVFGLSWSLGFLWMSGLDINDKKYKKFIDTLESYWYQSKGQLGGRMTLEADADDTSNALFVLNSAGRLIDVQNCSHILNYFRGNRFVTYKYELTPSITTNFHCLLSLKPYKINEEIKGIIEETIKWIRNQINTKDKYLFRDKWHFSPFYPLSRAVLALEGIDDELCQMCVHQIIELQQDDGGWGMNGITSLEETAYAVLSISYWIRNGHKEGYDKGIQSIERGKNFIEMTKKMTLWPFWITKSLYCLTDTVETLIYSAKNSKYR